jgi:hypothetical protein
LNSDSWWYYRGAKGPRYDLAVPLDGAWTVSLTCLRQRIRSTPMEAKKMVLAVAKRF